MMTNDEKIANFLRNYTRDEARAGIRLWAVTDLRNRRKAVAQMLDSGWEVVYAPYAQRFLSDGRAVVLVLGQMWALRKDIHAARIAEALAQAQQLEADKRAVEPETKSVVGTETLSVLSCPKCGDTLQHTAVCPKCAAGKLGYRHRYTCVCGAIEIISQEAL